MNLENFMIFFKKAFLGFFYLVMVFLGGMFSLNLSVASNTKEDPTPPGGITGLSLYATSSTKEDHAKASNNESGNSEKGNFALSSSQFKSIIHKYSTNPGVKMDMVKETYLKLLNKKKVSRGEIFLKNGFILLRMEDTVNTQVIFDKKNLWQIQSPDGEKKQVTKINLDPSHQDTILLSVLFYPDLFFKTFIFFKDRSKGRSKILTFKPIDKASNIQSVSLKIEEDVILTLWLNWKNPENKETYIFSNIRFNQNIPSKYFKTSGG